MLEMTARHDTFMSAMLRASKVQNSVVRLVAVCEDLKIGADECGEFVRWAVKAGLVNQLGNDQAILTAAGRDLAEGRAFGRR